MNTPAHAISDLLYRIEQNRRALLSQALAGHHLSHLQWLALKTLWRKKPCSMTELAHDSAIDRTSLTRTVDSLIARGCVARSSLPGDRRAVIVETTASGAMLASAVWLDIEVLEQQMCSLLDEASQARLLTHLGWLLDGLGSAAPLDDAVTGRSRLM